MRARRRQHMRKATKMKAQPSAMSRISHHWSGRWTTVVLLVVGVSMPVMVGRGLPVAVEVVTTRSDRQMPSPDTTEDEPLQLAAVHEPPWRTWLLLAHARQLLGPAPEQLEQLESQDWHVDDVVSKNWFWLHVGRHRPFVSTGRSEGQLEHWLKLLPEQVAQSG